MSRRPSRSAIVSLILDSLPPVQRLALAYAPRRAREAWLGLLALDTRPARLAEPPEQRPQGEPLLALLGRTGAALSPLVDGWEALLGEAPLPQASIAAFAEGRAQALAGLGGILGLVGEEPAILRVGRDWALADLALRLSHPGERDHAVALIGEGAPLRLPREMRPLTVLHGLALRDLRRGDAAGGIRGALAAVRLGIFGR